MLEPRIFCIEVDINDERHGPNDPRSADGSMVVYVRARTERRALIEARCYCAGAISSRFSVGRAMSCYVPAIPPAPDLDVVALEDADAVEEEAAS